MQGLHILHRQPITNIFTPGISITNIVTPGMYLMYMYLMYNLMYMYLLMNVHREHSKMRHYSH